MEREAYLDKESWAGLFYELAIVYTHRDGAQLLRAIATLWASPGLRGPWHQRENFGQGPMLPSTLTSDGYHFLYGAMALPGHGELGCLSLTVREEHGSDWLDFCLPTGMLDRYFAPEYPLSHLTNPWMTLIDSFFLVIAARIYATAPFAFALIGEEVSGVLAGNELTAGDLARGGVLVPRATAEQLGESGKALAVGAELCWFPPNY